MPKIVPNAVPRMIGPIDTLMSGQVGHRPVTLVVTTVRSSLDSRFVAISAKPNSPIATPTKPMPSESSGIPKLKRAMPELTSVPTSPSNSPTNTIAMALIRLPCASTTAATRPSTIIEKYSAAPNSKANSASGGPNSAMSTVPTQPAKNDPTAPIARGGPARPRRPNQPNEPPAHAAGEKRPDRRYRHRRTRPPLLAHLVAVDTGHHRGGLPRQIHQNRRGRAPVARPVVNT